LAPQPTMKSFLDKIFFRSNNLDYISRNIKDLTKNTPADLTVESLVTRVQSTEVKEVILALPASMEGDTTAFYLAKRIQSHDILLTTIARGVSVGEALQYADEATLSSSLLNRLPYKG
ncbi:MAG: toprim domain-containing protein, partial [Flavobacteriales bacterium]